MGQFFTPAPIAAFMSSLFEARRQDIRILDAGAGVGMLTAACVARFCSEAKPPNTIRVVAYEDDPGLIEYLNTTVAICSEACSVRGIHLEAEVCQTDFVRAAVTQLERGLFSEEPDSFTTVIMNPPYRKIRNESDARRLLDSIQMPTTNLYAAFVWLSVRLLETGGDLVAITPRSFCNGPYFREFRRAFLDTVTLRRIHVFESRDLAFREDDVLQENIIIYAVKGKEGKPPILLSSSDRPLDNLRLREVEYDSVVHPDDKDSFVHIPTDDMADEILERVGALSSSLGDLGISVSTGRVVDFRAKEFLRPTATDNALPLIYPGHFSMGFVVWPKLNSKKPNALAVAPETEPLFVPTGYYVLTKRFTAKEEARRVVAAVYDPSRIPASRVGFENHLNYFHRHGSGLPSNLAKGLAIFLNSSLVDRYFRQFNGHTQVNATDLRKLRYPSREQLDALGAALANEMPTQTEIDALVEKELFAHAHC